MSIDNKLNQAESLVRIDEAHRSPGFARFANRIAEGFATSGIIGALAAFSDTLNAATRAKERVERIARILSNSAQDGPLTTPDDVEEMSVAMELSDRDVAFLRKLVNAQGRMLDNHDRLTRHASYTTWPWGEALNAELDSVFSKLESYGLVSRIAPPNNLNIQADFQNRYALLKKGLRFTNYIQKLANSSS